MMQHDYDFNSKRARAWDRQVKQNMRDTPAVKAAFVLAWLALLGGGGYLLLGPW